MTNRCFPQPSHRLAARLFCLVVLIATPAVAQGTFPQGTIFNAGTVYPNAAVQSNNTIAGGYFGNGSGKNYDLAVTNSSGSGPALIVFNGNGDGTFSTTSYAFTGSTIQGGLTTIYAGPLTGPGKVDLVATDQSSNLFLVPGTATAPSPLPCP